MAILKPINPMENGAGAPFYPLTHASQVVCGEGENKRRLEQDGMINADILNGKNAKYYLGARNLLDNSDFTNPIAQAGIGGMHGTAKYAIDRWWNEYGYGTFSQSESGLKITYSGGQSYITQKILNTERLVGKPLTLAVKTSNNLYVNSCQVFNTGSDVLIWFGPTESAGKISATLRGDGVRIVVESGEVTLEWAALYEGEYTADNLPPYVPKGYDAELAECRRYYQVIRYDNFGLTIVSQRHGAGFRGAMQIAPMRIYNPTVTWDYSKTVISAGSVNINIAEVTAAVFETILWIIGTAETEMTTGGAGLLYGNQTGNKIEISADL